MHVHLYIGQRKHACEHFLTHHFKTFGLGAQKNRLIETVL